MIKQHESMIHPDSNTKLWRYMDFTKLLYLLEKQTLVFPNANSFEDPYEGTWPQASFDILTQEGRFPEDTVGQLISGLQNLKKEMFISCWYMSEHESAAMWDLYLSSKEGVAIQTDTDTLFSELNNSDIDIYVSKVSYLDYDKQPVPLGNIFYPFTHKRTSFAHENELRAIIWNVGALEPVKHVDINPLSLIKAIHVSPRAPVWFAELVRSIVGERYQLEVPIETSALYKNPSYRA
ncbi:DUF2971 domain-containing protein [Vibrio vulnificus]|nr:DUF2971 domain-containing protein [Vibrio vulnificus]